MKRGAEELIHYFNSGEEPLSISVEKDGETIQLYTYEESAHMKDVKGLVRLDYGILFGTLGYLIMYSAVAVRRRSWRPFAQSILAGSVLTLALMAVLGIASMLDFDWLFLQFHLLAFSNDFWSAQGYMLKMFPGGFWYDATLFCVIGMVILAVTFGSISGGYLYFTGKGLHFQRLMS